MDPKRPRVDVDSRSSGQLDSQGRGMTAARYFSELGTRVLQSWRGRDCDPGSFAQVAGDVLDAFHPGDHVTSADIHRWLLPGAAAEASPCLPVQSGGGFGQPPVTVFNRGGVFIDVYFWRGLNPEIHNHPFAGAFCLLEGNTIHSVFDVDSVEDWATEVASAVVEGRSITRVGAREVVRFSPNQSSGLTHSLLHTARYSVSLVVRWKLPLQTRYYKVVGRGNNALLHYIDEPAERRSQLWVPGIELLFTLLQSEHPDFDAVCQRFLETTDLGGLLRLWGRLLPSLDQERRGQLAASALDHLGPRATRLCSAVSQEALLSRISTVSSGNDDLRYLHSALASCDTGPQLSRLLAGQGDGVALLGRWADHWLGVEESGLEIEWQRAALVGLLVERADRRRIESFLADRLGDSAPSTSSLDKFLDEMAPVHLLRSLFAWD